MVVGYFNLSALFVYQSVSFIIYLCSPLSYAHQLNCIFDGPIWLAHRSTLVISHFSLFISPSASACLLVCLPASSMALLRISIPSRSVHLTREHTHTYPKYVCGACILNVCPKTSFKPIDSFTFRRRHRRCSFYMCFCVQCNASIFGAGFDWKLQRLFFLALSLPSTLNIHTLIITIIILLCILSFSLFETCTARCCWSFISLFYFRVNSFRTVRIVSPIELFLKARLSSFCKTRTLIWTVYAVHAHALARELSFYRLEWIGLVWIGLDRYECLFFT